MTEPPTAQASQSPQPAVDPVAGPHVTVWERLKRHKVLQWTLAYAAAAYTLLHATQMLAESFDWPHLVVRVVTLGLLLALPVVVLLAWYHGHKAQHRFSTAELSLLTVLLLIAGTVMWGFTRIRAPSESASVVVTHATTEKVSAPTATEPAASVAVVPFANLTGDASKDYFSDGMAEELIDALANVPGLRVPSRTSSFAYKGHEPDVRRIAQDLGVAKVLEGSVRSAGETVRVTAQLVDAQTGYHVWSHTYERKFADIFKLQDELTKAILEQLLGKIGATSADSGIQAPSTQNVEAYELYLQARALAGVSTPPNLRRPLQLLDRALTLDPGYVDAWRDRASVRAVLAAFVDLSLPEMQQAEHDARQAEALRPNAGQGALAYIHNQLGRWVEAEREYQVALATVDRTEPYAHRFYAMHLAGTGRLKAALAQANEAYRLAPADLVCIMVAGDVNLTLGRDAEALKFANLASELGDPTHIADRMYALVALRAHRAEEASTRFTSALSEAQRAAGGAEVLKLLALATADPARIPEARKVLDAYTRRFPQGYVSNLILFGYMQVGALDEAYAIANRTLDAPSNNFQWVDLGPFVLWGPEQRPFRRDPRFQQLVTRLGLIDYWKQYGPPDDCDLHGETLTCR
jgi:TolB-like protein